MTDDDDLLPDDDDYDIASGRTPWLMLVVDDEPDVHAVTRVALADLSFQGRPLEIISAYSAKDAREILASREDIAVMLLDVVMETDHAGLELAREMRESMGITDIRIILRTGQPGQAPERDVILAFDINDYKAKTELTIDRLFTTVIAALRGYADIAELNRMRRDAYGQLSGQIELFKRAIALVPSPMMHIDHDGFVTAWNDALSALLGEVPNGEALADVLPELNVDGAEFQYGDDRFSVHASDDGVGGGTVVLLTAQEKQR